MSKYAVAYINFFNNNLTVEIVEANNWKEALGKHTVFNGGNESEENIKWLSDDIKAAQNDAFNADMLFDVKKVE